MKIARVFPSRTKATPRDSLAFIDCEPGLFVPEVDEVHISVAFTWHKERAEELAEAWKRIAPVKIGGPAYMTPGGEFEAGKYLKEGYTITSRGCPNKCWFCSVWRREPKLVELPIVDGWNIQDDNLLACSEAHVRAVFEMLKRQKKAGRKVEFTGGLEAARLQEWHVDLLKELKPYQMFFAYDTPNDEEPLRVASRMLKAVGFTRATMRAYCLIGGPKDTFEKAEARLRLCVELGFYPMAMLWRDEDGKYNKAWREFQQIWVRPDKVYRMCVSPEEAPATQSEGEQYKILL